MRKFIQLIIIVGIFAVAFHFRFEVQQKLQPYISNIQAKLGIGSPIRPCIEPIPYTLGTFDTKFGISKEYFLSALADAEAIWEKPYGKELFAYAPSGPSGELKVNLIYDYRQQATDKLEDLDITVENNRASYDTLRSKLDTLKVEYENEKRDYEARVAAFNRGNRTNEGEFRSLERERKDLNNKVDEINALVVAVNHLIGTLNLSVAKYNTTNVARGESFEEGVYVQDGDNVEIDIYEFSSRAKLVRVLAHELGHALGLDHVADPKAIMYELNQGNTEALTVADFEALQTQCGKK